MSELPPAPLRGVHVHLVAPSGYAPDPVVMTRGVARLRTAGCEVSGLQVLGRSDLRFAGSDAERAADINSLATLPELPDLVLAMRGGYGATRLLPHLNYAALRERLAGTSTALVGHSDFTALQLALCARSGLCTFTGPLLADLGAERYPAFRWSRELIDSVDGVLLSSEPYRFTEAHADVLERQIGKPVAGIMRADGISWTFGRQRSGPSI